MKMKTMNTNESIPEYFYIFLDFAGLWGAIHKNNFDLSHRIISSGINNMFVAAKVEDFVEGNIDYLPFVISETTSISPSSFAMNLLNEYNVEHNLEWYRKAHYKTYPSRLSGIYAFGDIESCLAVSRKYGWNMNSVRKFRLEDLGVCNIGIKVAKLNMEIVSMLRHIFIPRFSIEDQERIYEHYWNGTDNVRIEIADLVTNEMNPLDSGTIYEYLIEGVLIEVPL